MMETTRDIHVQFATKTRAKSSAAKRCQGRDTSENISVSDLTVFQADGSTILDGASLNLVPGRVYALFGNNGVGKTTLVRCLAEGRLELPKECRVHVMEQLYDPEGLAEYPSCLEYLATRDEHLSEVRARIADLEQRMEEDTSCDAGVVGGTLNALYQEEEELEQSQGSRLREALAAVGFGEKRMARRPRLLSGGWQMRLRVAAAVLCRPRLLVLDEPTNFLDLEGIKVLAELVQNVLRTDDSIIVVISHNRAFLETVSTDTIQMARKSLQLQTVPFGVFLEAARDREAHQNARYEKQQLAVQRFRATIAQIQGHLRSGKTSKGAGAVTSRQVKLELIAIGATNKTESGKKYYQSRSTNAPPLEPVLLEKPPRLSLQVATDAAGVVLSLDRAAIGIADVSVLENVSLSVSMGQRIGVLGKNGAGKSLLLRALAGELPLRGGSRYVAQGKTILFYRCLLQKSGQACECFSFRSTLCRSCRQTCRRLITSSPIAA